MRTRTKICGITRREDAVAAIELGAWALGFIFHEKSPRYIRPEAAGEIVAALPVGVKAVGVVVNAPAADLLQAARASGVGVIQFHGNEAPEELERTPFETIKAARLKTLPDVAALRAYKPSIGFLVDAAVKGEWGGTGELADWKLAREVKNVGPLILSGGLKPENVAQAVRELAPFAVDVATGVEAKPGIKDHSKLKAFFAEVEAGEA